MELRHRDEKTVKDEILYLMKDEEEGVSFATLLSVLDMSDQDSGYLHIILLDLCRDGYLRLGDGQYSSMEQMVFFTGSGEKTSEKMDAELNVAQMEDKAEPEKMEKPAIDSVWETEKPKEIEAVETDYSEKTIPCDNAVRIYQHLLVTLKSGEEWKSIRDLFSRGGWPKDKESCRVLPNLLVQMAMEGIVEIRTERDRISSVRPVFRYSGVNEQSVISEKILSLLRLIPGETEENESVKEQEKKEAGSVSGKTEENSASSEDANENRIPGEENLSDESDNSKEESKSESVDYVKENEKTEISAGDKSAESRHGIYGSWEIFDDDTAVKYCDKDFFDHKGSEVPEEILWFFDAEDLTAGQSEPIKIVYRGQAGSGLLNREADGKRTVRIVWNGYVGAQLYQYKKKNSVCAVFHRLEKFQYEMDVVCSEDSDVNKTDINISKENAATIQTTDSGVITEKRQEYFSVPYGYRVTESGITVEQDEAEVIHAVFKMRRNHMTLQAIADRLNALNKTTLTDRRFTPVAVNSILAKHRVYRGLPSGRLKNCPVILEENYMDRYNPISDSEKTLNISETAYSAANTEVKKPVDPSGNAEESVRAESTEKMDVGKTESPSGNFEVNTIPYGYEYVNKKVAIDPGEADLIRTTFDFHDAGVPNASIASRLAARGFRTRTGSRHLLELVNEIIDNRPLYLGETGYPAIVEKAESKAEMELRCEEPEKTEDVTDSRSESEPVSAEKTIQTPATQEEIQEEIYRVLYVNPGYHSVDGIQQLSEKLKRVPDYKIIFNANTLKSRNLIDEIITSPPDPIMYLYAAKIQGMVQAVITDRTEEMTTRTEEKKEDKPETNKDVQEFLEYCRVTPMSYAYKMILLLAYMKYADNLGNMHIDNAVSFFRQYYDDRRSRGLRAEKGKTIFADPDAAFSAMRRNIIENPVRALKSGGYFTYDSRSEFFSLRHFVWSRLSDQDKKEIVNICQRRLKEYFGDE